LNGSAEQSRKLCLESLGQSQLVLGVYPTRVCVFPPWMSIVIYIYININININIYIYICNGGKGMNMMDSIFWQPIFRQTHFTTALDFADLNDARKTIPREQNEVSFMSDAASKLSQLFLRA
jgi:hypothetical protein